MANSGTCSDPYPSEAVDEKWENTVDGIPIVICKRQGYLNISVTVPASRAADFSTHDDYVALIEKVLAEYLKLSDDAAFECPGLETVSESETAVGYNTLFRLPLESLKVTKK
jgi:hypothetical protein